MDPLALPNPQAVSLNHLYCTAIKDGMMVLGATQRYREKFFTVVFYSVCPTTGTYLYFYYIIVYYYHYYYYYY
jgi:hypothetical protein